jgi:hypothetical protein
MGEVYPAKDGPERAIGKGKGGSVMKLQEGPRNTIIMLKADLVHRVMGLIREGRAGKNPWGVSQATWIAEAKRIGLKVGKTCG